MNVTLIALLRPGGSRARAHRLKELGMKHKSFFIIILEGIEVSAL
jgi:hypothetical protein